MNCSFRVTIIYDGKTVSICEADFIESVINYCKTEGRFHHQTFTIERWLESEQRYVEIANFYEGTEIPF